MWYNKTSIDIFLGKTMKSVTINDNNDEILFVTDTDKTYIMYHSQNCCESVYIEDIEGDLQDLVGSPMLQAEEVSNTNTVDYGDEEWTFYKLATIKGYVTIRWYGSSNGWYSTSVDIGIINDEDEEE